MQRFNNVIYYICRTAAERQGMRNENRKNFNYRRDRRPGAIDIGILIKHEISSPSLDNAHRLQQQFNVITSAMKSDVEHVVYVGLANAEKRLFDLEDVDMATEHMILALGMPYTFMRNPVYLDVFQCDFHAAMSTGRLLSITRGQAFKFLIINDHKPYFRL